MYGFANIASRGRQRDVRHFLSSPRRRVCAPAPPSSSWATGAVGLLGVLSAKQMGAQQIIAMNRHETRQKLAREFGATEVVTERGEEGAARILDLTNGIGADSALECVGTQESMWQAIGATRPGGY